eukprot:SAG11_NODE_284_length_11240_cov_6.333812_1_plen_35_part_00
MDALMRGIISLQFGVLVVSLAHLLFSLSSLPLLL